LGTGICGAADKRPISPAYCRRANWHISRTCPQNYNESCCREAAADARLTGNAGAGLTLKSHHRRYYFDENEACDPCNCDAPGARIAQDSLWCAADGRSGGRDTQTRHKLCHQRRFGYGDGRSQQQGQEPRAQFIDHFLDGSQRSSRDVCRCHTHRRKFARHDRAGEIHDRHHGAADLLEHRRGDL